MPRKTQTTVLPVDIPAPKKRAPRKKVMELQPAAVEKEPEQGSVAWLRKQFTDYEPSLQKLSPRTDYRTYNNFFPFAFPSGVERRARLDQAFINAGKDAYGVGVSNMTFDTKTFVESKAGARFTATPFWWQVEQGKHPVLPKVDDIAQFFLDWINDLKVETKKGVYTGTHDKPAQRFRFCVTEASVKALPPYIQKYALALVRSDYSLYFEQARFANISALVGGEPTKATVPDPLIVPVVTAEEAFNYASRAPMYHASYFNEFPSVLEFQDNREMLERVMKHCESIPGFKVHYLRKMLIAHSVGAEKKAHPTCMNNKNNAAVWYNCRARDVDKVLVLSETQPGAGYVQAGYPSYPHLYVGPAWAISFSMFGTYACKETLVYFAEWADFKAQFEKYAPHHLEGVPEFSDLVFIGSHWCERNSARGKMKGVHEQQDPINRQLSLRNWILGPMMTKVLASTKLDGVTSHSGAITMKKLEIVNETIGNLKDNQVVKPKYTPIWAKQQELLEKEKAGAK